MQKFSMQCWFTINFFPRVSLASYKFRKLDKSENGPQNNIPFYTARVSTTDHYTIKLCNTQSFLFLYFLFVCFLSYFWDSSTKGVMLIQRVSFACFETVTEWRPTETQAAVWTRTRGLLCSFVSLTLSLFLLR